VSGRGRNGRDDEDAAPAERGPDGPDQPREGAAPPRDETATSSTKPEAGQETPDQPAGLEPAAAEELVALRRERDELKDSLLRRRAEFENYRKRVERERQVAEADAAASVFKRVLDTVDNLERALATPEGEGAEAVRQGVELTLRELRTMLESQGVAAVDPLGEPFDPRLHQALLHEHVPGYAAGVVAEVFRKGYTLNDRLLRPALVKVASGASDEDPADARGGPDVQ
jgi:molecular chaperone GrpE